MSVKEYARKRKVNFYELFNVWCGLVKKRPSQLTTSDVDQFIIDRQNDDWVNAVCLKQLGK